MKVHRDLSDLPQFRNAVITIGSFDGVHKGHQKILKKVKDLALATSGESIVITFHPHPRQIVYPKDTSLRLITTTEEKIELLAKSGIDHLVIVPFTFEFSQISADEYIQRFLVTKFHPKYIVIGYDHRFGLNRQGGINYLRWHEAACGYQVEEIEKQEIDAAAISSSKVRKYLMKGAVKPASHLMGHFFSLRGKVVKGQQIGTSIGFPTANIELKEKVKLVPPDGIYAAYAIFEGQRHQAMLYIGVKPTIKGANKRTIEVHIFDFSSEIYESELQVELVDFIRHDATFKDIETLRKKLEEDKIRSEAILSKADNLARKWEQQQLPSVGVVILNFNGKKYLEQNLPSVLKSSYPNFQVIVADNASKDDSIEFLQAHFPEVGILELQQNHGFAKGYNLALQDLDNDYFVLLNSDVETPEHWLEPLVELLESDRTIAAVQPKIRAMNEPDYFEYAGAAGGWIDFLGYPFCRGRIFDTVEKDRGQYDQVTEIFWASGACMAVRAPLFKGFGGFDADFFAHLEEIDLCWRFKRAGYKVMFTPRSMVYHLGGGTLAYNSPYKTYLNFRNSYYTLLKNESVIKLAFLLPIRVMMDTVAAISFLLKGRWLHAQAVVGAFLTFFLALVTFIKKRIDLEDLIQRVRILPQPNRQGIYPKSIVFQYFAAGKKLFKNL
jgi:riboflavin kinase/FMN adenylyltransferase